MGTLALIELAGLVALMLWGLHMVQSGIERAWGGGLRHTLRRSLKHPFAAFASGIAATALLQSSTATGLIVAGFTSTGLMALGTALAVMLGANVGTTLLVQILSFDISLVTPLLILAGVIAFRASERAPVRDLGRAMIGLGLILFALHEISALLTEAARSEALRTLFGLVETDRILTLLFGAVLAMLMLGSLPMVLLTMSLAASGLVPLDMAFVLVLGANLGTAVNPLLAVKDRSNPAGLRLPVGNLINRLVGCAIGVVALIFVPLPQVLTAWPAQSVAGFHLAFNIVMAVAFFPILPWLARWLERRLPERVQDDPMKAHYLDPAHLSSPPLAIAAAAREVMRMSDVIEDMLRRMADALMSGDRNALDRIRETDDILDRLNEQVKSYLTALPGKDMPPEDRVRADAVLAYSLSLEHAGDIISNSLVKRAGKQIRRRLVFSDDGKHELRAMFDHVTRTVSLASAVMMTGNERAARELREDKWALDDMEAEATRGHLDRLREGRTDSRDSSAVHLDVLRDLRQINSELASIAKIVSKDGAKRLNPNLKLA